MSAIATWPAQAESWLDRQGRPAWIIAMVLGFIVFWPVGLALLGYMIWSNRMTCRSKLSRFQGRHASKGTGNAAFDAYKADTLRRLEEEQEQFEAFLQRLRDARDKAEFDQFIDERRKPAEGQATS
ncbi:MAG: hypothetical protein VR71_02350 [Roseovarius sp. BRH_c41]|jgi:hypothetical protein|uniref:DUF2852 domain-containing protein n=1 Tax=Roseovarius sp. BRH_c41 TaxID=1629709 RepID=UPI0005F21A83|nr:DUF2852 domain-containing protein [Roseovarius sp. BRH_c41]KJS45269.1 MAG: hypothetical protein VR71_02350 [Roseovarius sp. BRH_c41]